MHFINQNFGSVTFYPGNSDLLDTDQPQNANKNTEESNL